MSASVYELIGEIINPRPPSHTPAPPRAPTVPTESLQVLIGRIISPQRVVIQLPQVAPPGETSAPPAAVSR